MDECYNKHYIRLDTSGRITRGFSDAFEQPEKTDICINTTGGRHFELLGQVNPAPVDIRGIHLYKYVDSTVQETTAEEQAAELAAMPVVKTETIEDKVNALTLAMADLIGA